MRSHPERDARPPRPLHARVLAAVVESEGDGDLARNARVFARGEKAVPELRRRIRVFARCVRALARLTNEQRQCEHLALADDRLTRGGLDRRNSDSAHVKAFTVLHQYPRGSAPHA